MARALARTEATAPTSRGAGQLVPNDNGQMTQQQCAGCNDLNHKNFHKSPFLRLVSGAQFTYRVLLSGEMAHCFAIFHENETNRFANTRGGVQRGCRTT